MLFFTGTAHSSWTILKEQEESTRTAGGAAVEALHEVKALSERVRAALQQGDVHQFGELLHEGWQAKRRISTKISTPRIDQLYNLALEHGAVGGKITGAGSGGFLLFYSEPDNQQAVRDVMHGQGIHEMTFEFDMQGAQSIVNDPFIDGDERGGSRWVFVPKTPRAKTFDRPMVPGSDL